MKSPNEIFQEFVAEHGLQRLAWEVHFLNDNGRWYQDGDHIVKLRHRLCDGGYGSVADALPKQLVEYECVRRIAWEK